MSVDLVCFSHLRWDFVYQRPNHLMARAARDRRVFFVQEPVDGARPGLATATLDGVIVVSPSLPPDLTDEGRQATLHDMMSAFFGAERLVDPVLWYYTPMPLPWTAHLSASAIVYDVMDDLSSFRFAPPELLGREGMLLERADVVFTGGRQLFEAKRHRHPNVHLFPSSVDVDHFAAARTPQPDPHDQARIPRPRIGYYGVIDERIDVELLRDIAMLRPEWQLVLIGPITKVDPETLPSGPSVHLLGAKRYAELPRYLAGWDAAMMPFALNEATRHISPTKTPEYLAGGRPVASTPIRDVVDPYGTLDLVSIGNGPNEFVAAVERALATDVGDLCRRADALLRQSSWDRTWREMDALVAEAARRRAAARRPRVAAVRRVPVSSTVASSASPPVSASSPAGPGAVE